MRKLIQILLVPGLVAAALVAAPETNAVAAGALFVISPTALDFGQGLLGSTSPRQAVTVRNVSGAPVVMDGSGGGTSSPFASTDDCQGKTLLVNATCQVFYQFKPTALGTATGSTTGVWNGQTYTISLTGVGEPRFRISPTTFDLGDVPLGTIGPQQRVTITNLSAPVVMSGAGGGAGQFGGSQDCQGLTLGTGKSCHMYYRFDPVALGPATGSTGGNWNGQTFSFHFTGNGVPLPSGDFIPVRETRLFDSRLSSPLIPNQQEVFSSAESTPAPLSAAAVDLQVTALPRGKAGTLTVWPCGAPMPKQPTMRFQAHAPITNHVQASFNASGLTCVQSTKSVNATVDIDGYYSSTSSFHALTPKRVENTTGGNKPTAGKVLRITVTGGSVPPGATAVALNLTALSAAQAGHLTAFPCGSNVVSPAALQFQAHQPETALAISKIGTHGQVCVRTSAAANVLADLTGYYTAPSAFTPIRPTHVLNTATHFRYSGSKPKANQVVHVTVTGGGVPTSPTNVVLDVTASSEAKAGQLFVYSCGQVQPAMVTIRFQPNVAITNLALSRVINGGKVCIRSTQATHLSVDVVGYYD